MRKKRKAPRRGAGFSIDGLPKIYHLHLASATDGLLPSSSWNWKKNNHFQTVLGACDANDPPAVFLIEIALRLEGDFACMRVGAFGATELAAVCIWNLYLVR
jgi:hypothetical protein